MDERGNLRQFSIYKKQEHLNAISELIDLILKYDIRSCLKKAKNTDLIVTTEKDKVKLRPLARQAGALARFGFIPIQIDFGRDTDAFRAWLQQQVEEPVRHRLVRY